MEVRLDPEGFDRLFVSAPEWDAEFEVCGACPVQVFGTVRGRDLYFRARNGEWSFDVADSAGNLPSDGYHDSDRFYRMGIDPPNGYMPLPEAVAVIAECLREYTASNTLIVGEVYDGHLDNNLNIWSVGSRHTHCLRTTENPINTAPGTGILYNNTNNGAFMSRHSGGANFALGDGSVRFLPQNMDITLYRNLSTIKGGEVASPN